jgi:hypothetical protein
MIYFIKNGRCIKAGYAKDIAKRLKGLKTGIPELELIGSMEGERGHERTLHDMLEPWHVDGEWFRDCEEVRAIIADAVANGVSEWKPCRRYSGVPDDKWNRQAVELIAIVCEGKSAPDFAEIETCFNLTSGLLWQMKYRGREVTVGEYFALLHAAEKIIKMRLAAIERQAQFVDSIIRENADSDNRLFEAQRSYRALVGED